MITPEYATSADNLGRTPLHMAVATHNVNIARELLECGASVNVADVYGNTPLTLACSGGDANIIALLLSYGADGIFYK